jgi:hypothetical protein
MKLTDLRKLTVKKHLRVHFNLQNGMECIVDEHGLAQIPALNKVPDFNLEQELVAVQEFVLEMPKETDKKGVAKRQTLGREQLAAMTSAPAAGAAAGEHEEE